MEQGRARPRHDGALQQSITVNDAVGPRAIGAAINALDREDKRLRVRLVRDHTFAEPKEALLDARKDEGKEQELEALWP